MRRLQPNRRGIVVPTQQTIHTAGHLHAYNQPTRALKNLENIIEGNKPRIIVSRKQGGIGDVMMTTPTAKAISKKFNCKIDYATDFGYLDGALVKVLHDIPYIESIIPWREVDFESYNAVIELTCPCIAHERPLVQPINRIDLFARHAGIRLTDTSMDYVITKEELDWAEQYLVDHNLDPYRLILVQPSSSTTNRDAPVQKIKRALEQVLSLDRTAHAIVITHNSDNVSADWRFADIHVLNNFDVRQIAAIMHCCHLVLCPDSGVLHLASALHKPTVTLFGPTDPHARVNYHPEAVAIWPGKDLHNYPCWYEDPGDGYLCWKRLEEPIIAKCCLALLHDDLLPESSDIVTYGDYEQARPLYEVL